MKENDYIELCNKFVNTPNSLIVAPAGFGKTHIISEVIFGKDVPFLVLTHTHAGIAAIKEKLKSKKVPNTRYTVETIAGYCQKYVHAYTNKDSIPDQHSKDYYKFVYERFGEIIRRKSIHEVIKASYEELIVDEYQDCDESQHSLIVALGKIINVHVLGDGMQGIFEFNESPINWDDIDKEFTLVGELDKQWRWIIGENESLGHDINAIRGKLTLGESLDLKNYPSIEYKEVIRDNRKDFYKIIREIIDTEGNVLIIEPDSANKIKRLELIKQFKSQIHMIESIDDQDFYLKAKLIDSMDESNFYELLLDLLKGNKLKVVKKKKTRSKPLITNISSLLPEKLPDRSRIRKINPLMEKAYQLSDEFELSVFSDLLELLSSLKGVNIPSKDLFYSLLNATRLAVEKGVTVHEAMVEIRNNLRRVGRKLYGKVIGTTLLTKGLEMTCVVILDAHTFNDKKNFYVAISRASKRLIILTNNSVLSPYSEPLNARSQAEQSQIMMW